MKTTRLHFWSVWLVVACLTTFILPQDRCWADEKLKDIACRSVHLGYPGEKATAFYNEVTVKESAPGTYFSVIGWDKGYFGIQQLANNKKLIIFSVWDSGENDPNATPNQLRTELLYQDPAVRVKRFGGEGSGGQSFYDFDWQIDQTYQFLLSSRVIGNRTAYSGYFFEPTEKAWKHLVTFSTITGGKPMSGFYSFVEDFKRDRKSTKLARTAIFGNSYRLPLDAKDWKFQSSARFTGDSNPVTNINAKLVENRFLLATGGETKHIDVPLWDTFECEGQGDSKKLNALQAVIQAGDARSKTPVQRKEDSQSLLRSKRIPYLAQLPPLPTISKTARRNTEEVLDRAIALTLVAAKADRVKSQSVVKLAAKINHEATLTPAELAYFQSQKPDATAEANFIWEYESGQVLLWALGLEEELLLPTEISSATKAVELLAESSRQQLLDRCNLRSQSDLLDQADLTYRLHWSVVNAKYMDSDPPANLEPEVLQQRHHACAWLLGLTSLESENSSEPKVSWNDILPRLSRTQETGTIK